MRDIYIKMLDGHRTKMEYVDHMVRNMTFHVCHKVLLNVLRIKKIHGI